MTRRKLFPLFSYFSATSTTSSSRPARCVQTTHLVRRKIPGSSPTFDTCSLALASLFTPPRPTSGGLPAWTSSASRWTLQCLSSPFRRKISSRSICMPAVSYVTLPNTGDTSLIISFTALLVLLIRRVWSSSTLGCAFSRFSTRSPIIQLRWRRNDIKFPSTRTERQGGSGAETPLERRGRLPRLRRGHLRLSKQSILVTQANRGSSTRILDLKWWASLSSNPNFGRYICPLPSAVLFRDASMWVWGAICNEQVPGRGFFDSYKEAPMSTNWSFSRRFTSFSHVYR